MIFNGISKEKLWYTPRKGQPRRETVEPPALSDRILDLHIVCRHYHHGDWKIHPRIFTWILRIGVLGRGLLVTPIQDISWELSGVVFISTAGTPLDSPPYPASTSPISNH